MNAISAAHPNPRTRFQRISPLLESIAKTLPNAGAATMTCHLNPKASFDRVSLAENAGSVVRVKRQFEGRGAFQQLNDHVMPEELLDQTEASCLNQN